MKTNHNYLRYIFIFTIILIIFGCEDKITKWDLTINVTPDNSGTVIETEADVDLNGSYKYEDNTELTITATPETGWKFSHWEGDLTGSTNPTTIVMDGDKSVTAVFVKLQYPLTVTITGDGEVTEEIVAAKTTDYDHGSSIQLTAIPDTGWEFSHWEGDLTGSDNPAIITMDSNKSITAVFIQIPYSVNLTIIGNGTVTKSPDQATYFYNSSVQLTATPETGWTFDQWTGDLTGSTNPINLTIEGNITAVAIFIQLHTLTTNVDGNGTISLNPNSATYKHNSQVQLTANADQGWTFDHWEGDLTGTDNPATITMDGNKSVTAVFTQDRTLTTNVDGNGTISLNPNSATYKHNSQVQLTANADQGWTFDHWEGDLSGSDNPTTILMNSDKSITAVFIEEQYTLTVNIIGNGTVTINPLQASYPYGTDITLTANPKSDIDFFKSWTGGITSSQITVRIHQNINIDAEFQVLNDMLSTCVTSVMISSTTTLTSKIVNRSPVSIMINSAMLAAPNGSVIQIGGGGQLPSFYYMQHNFNISNAYQLVQLLNDGYFIVWQYSYNGKYYEKRYYLNGTIGDC